MNQPGTMTTIPTTGTRNLTNFILNNIIEQPHFVAAFFCYLSFKIVGLKNCALYSDVGLWLTPKWNIIGVNDQCRCVRQKKLGVRDDTPQELTRK